MRLNIDWDQPIHDVGAVDDELQKRDVEKQVLRTLVRALLMNAPCSASTIIRAGSSTVTVADAAVVLGMSYSPFLVGADPANDDPISAAAVAGARRLVPTPGRIVISAGDWLCLSLCQDPRVTADAPLLASASLHCAMRNFSSTMRERPFELMCVEALCTRSALAPGSAVRDILPHLATSLIGQEPVPVLRVVFLPKVVLNAAVLSDILGDRTRWTGASQITLLDLAWVLTVWLESGTIMLLRDYHSGFQDFVMRLGTRFLGVANKADGPEPGTQWAKISEELHKAPSLPSPFSYTLVLWSLSLGEHVTKAMGGQSCTVLGPGTWCVTSRGRGLSKKGSRGTAKKATVFIVGARSELVLVSPRAAGPGIPEFPDGLCESSSDRTLVLSWISCQRLGTAMLMWSRGGPSLSQRRSGSGMGRLAPPYYGRPLNPRM